MRDKTAKTSSASPAVTSSGGGTLYLIFIQVASRGFTFVGNQFLLRYLSPSLLGLAVQLELLSVTVLYFARESIRVALQRRPTGGQGGTKPVSSDSQKFVNLAYLAVLVGLCAATGFGYGYLKKSSHEVLESLDFWLAFCLYAIATVIELLAEPCFVIIQQYALYKARARAETAAAMARCVSACVAALAMHSRQQPASVLPFAIGQLSYAQVLFTTYMVNVWSVTKAENSSLLPRRMTNVSTTETDSPDYWLGLFSKPLLSLAATFYAQSVFKLFLTSGDSFILSFLTDLKSQGAFALASNYGGLLSRLVFQPVEESSRNIFGRLLSSQPSSATQVDAQTNSSSSSPKPTTTQPQHKTDLTPQQTTNTNKALTHLSTTLRLYTLFSLPLLTLLPPILPALTNLVLSAQWRTPQTTILLQSYIHYIPFVAVNGVLDALITTVATPAQLQFQNILMAAITAAYGGVAWVLMATSPFAAETRALVGRQAACGSEGLVYANIVNMAMRIVYSVWFISGWVKREGGGSAKVKWLWKRSLPGLSCIVTSAAVGGGLRSVLQDQDLMKVTKRFLGIRGLSLQDVGYVLSGAITLGISIVVSEHEFLLNMVMPLLPKRLAVKIQPYLPKASVKQE